MKDVAFGQYYPAVSFVHKMDPRLKFLFLIAYVVALFLATSFIGLGACAAVLLLIVLFSRVPPFKVLRALSGVLIIVLLTTVLNVFFYRGETLLWSWWKLTVTKEGLIFSGFLLLRLALLVLCSSMLTYTTTPVELTDGIESLFTPLKWVRFPVHELALVMSIALRFIPVLMDETERIKNAQKARGADFESGGLIKKTKAVIPILIPLLLSALRRAEELGDAMDARCYSGGKNRTKYKKLRFGWRDFIGFLMGAALVTGVVLLRVYGIGVL